MEPAEALEYRREIAKGLFRVMAAELREVIASTEDDEHAKAGIAQLLHVNGLRSLLGNFDSAELDSLIENARVLLTDRWLAQAGFPRR